MSDSPTSPLSGPMRDAVALTITLYGDNDRIDQALSEELERRGCRIHAVSVETGWLRSAETVICRLDTVSGQRALEGLAGHNQPHATIIAVCEKPTDELESKRLHDLCEECGRHHDVSLIWHSSVADGSTDHQPPADQLAVSVVDEVSAAVGARGSSFSSRYLDLS